MANDDQGGSLSQRLMARNSAPALQRVSMPDGGEAYTGPLASRALKALGARAFTVDKSVILDRKFDRDRPEDMALYAHERFHQRMAQGKSDDAENGASHDGQDAEEKAARAMEAMVLHRAKRQEPDSDFRSIMSDVNRGALDDAAKQGGAEPQAAEAGAAPGKANAMEGYKALRRQGRTHRQVVEELRDHVLRTMDEMNQDHAFRSGGGGFL